MKGGTIDPAGGLAFDQGAVVGGGKVEVAPSATLTFGTAGLSPASTLSGGTLALKGTLLDHRGFTMTGGTLTTKGAATSTIRMDPGRVFALEGGTVYVTPAGTAMGTLTIDGSMLAAGGVMVNPPIEGIIGRSLARVAPSGSMRRGSSSG
jgi:formylmethanofuran dehydrogenase subunit C